MPRRNGSGIALLADPTRRRIIQLLAIHPRRPSAIARELGLSRPAISRQLRILRDAALIRERPTPHDRRGALYGIHPDSIGRIVAWLAGTEIGVQDDMRLTPRKMTRVEHLARELKLDVELVEALTDDRWLPTTDRESLE